MPTFHRPGLAYFWALNDACDPDALQPQLDAFAAAGNVAAICLHPRAGLLLPYGGDAWFNFIRDICRRAARLDLPVWLYDEDPYPSGNAGGRVVMDHPEFQARGIQMFTHTADRVHDDPRLFCFPAGKLLWAGLIRDDSDHTIDLAAQVGVIRRQWRVHDRIDTRFFYPETPRYECPMAETVEPELAVQVPSIPTGMRLVAFVARPAANGQYVPFSGTIVDTLNPDATQYYLKLTHERYAQSVGDLFGKEIQAIFTDESKLNDTRPYSAGLLEEFEHRHGYDLRPRLHHLFIDSPDPRAMQTRLHYRRLVANQFRTAWLQPVAQWCRDHHLALVGHLSPEDDPIQQTDCLGNLFPLFKDFSIPGIDLIIPAAGDQQHPLLNIGVVSAASVAQQQSNPGVMSETGACADQAPAADIARILRWQAVMGVTAPLIHCAFASERGPRAFDFPPNYGPTGRLWPHMPDIHRELADIHQHTRDARQIAPVAILWPIRSFNARFLDWQNDVTGMRRQLYQLLAACLDRQIGVHLIDENDLLHATLSENALALGLARYEHLLIPECLILHTDTIKRLHELHRARFSVTLTGSGPHWQETPNAIEPAVNMPWPRRTPANAIESLPRLIDLPGDATDLRCTAWHRGNRTVRLLMNLRPTPFVVDLATRSVTLEPAEVLILQGDFPGHA